VVKRKEREMNGKMRSAERPKEREKKEERLLCYREEQDK
jgi:hypothetical protein